MSDSFQQQLQATPDLVVLRNLRRRFFDACCRDDGPDALRLYLATRHDWDCMVRDEVLLAVASQKKRETRGADKAATAAVIAHERINNNNQKKSTVGMLQQHMHPTEPFTADDYESARDPRIGPPDETPVATIKHRRTLFFHRNKLNTTARRSTNSPPADTTTARLSTCPLHEAARMGCAQLVRTMLLNNHHDIDCNVRTSLGQTPLILVAGGVARNHFTKHILLGIRAPQRIVVEKQSTNTVQTAVRRFFSKKTAANDSKLTKSGHVDNQVDQTKDEEDRLDCVVAILSWSHPDDGTELAGQGPFVNSVDSFGRGALHYAAELGRRNICDALMACFGTILTIVDDGARTPCELAAQQGHDELAAVLEARALLYVDPYGMDEELLAASSQQQSGTLTPPFSWHETMTMEKVQQERQVRIDRTFANMLKVVQMKYMEGESTLDDTINRSSAERVDESEKMETIVTTISEPAPLNLQGESTKASLDAATNVTDALASSPVKLSTSQARNEHKTGAALPDQLQDIGPIRELSVFKGLNNAYVEMFLKYHEWDEKNAVMRFLEDPLSAFQEAAVPVPRYSITNSLTNSKSVKAMCLICCDEFETGVTDWRQLKSCEHSFCTGCLGDYLTDCAASKTTGMLVTCPHHECDAPLSPLEIAELTPTKAVHESLINSANENFVATARDFRYCPYAGCEGIVKFSTPSFVRSTGLDLDLLDTVGAVCTATSLCSNAGNAGDRTYEGVYDQNYSDCNSTSPPRRAHRFCFVCGETGIHWPVPCKRLEEWKKVVHEHVQKVVDDYDGKDGNLNHNDIAQKLWLTTNTRPCPRVSKICIQRSSYCVNVLLTWFLVQR
jgi:hypothetical protein